MKTLRRFFGLFADSPTYERDRGNLVSGFTIGTTGVLLNLAVMMLAMPLLFNPDDRDFREVTQHIEFGQLLALILLGGATAFATFLIPLRLASVFWGPRIGRYFDQIVLSGISPFRFVIGKVTSQNLFLCLIAFLLTPWLILSLTLGGVNPTSFLAGLFLIWLYCMMLALVTIWMSLYFNELLSALLVTGAAAAVAGLGFIPMKFQPFCVTPFPALIHPVYSAIPYFEGMITTDFLPVFLSSAAGMSTVICVSLIAIYLGPVYGIIRENSTFGEVVRAGDTKRKRWIRIRLHIQRPSELAFFYENRGDAFRRHEGLIRWGLGSGGLMLLIGTATSLLLYLVYVPKAPGGYSFWRETVAVTCFMIHGSTLVLAAYLFSHTKNSTCLKMPVLAGRRLEVGWLDAICFLSFVVVSTVVSVGTAFLIEHFHVPIGQTLFTVVSGVDYLRAIIEGSLVLSVAGLLIYSIHRWISLSTWTKTVSFFLTAVFYVLVVCLLPFIPAVLFVEAREYFTFPFAEWTPTLAIISPFTVMGYLFDGIGRRFPKNVSTAPFYIFHVALIFAVTWSIRRRGKTLRQSYPVTPKQGTAL